MNNNKSTDINNTICSYMNACNTRSEEHNRRKFHSGKPRGSRIIVKSVRTGNKIA